MEQHPFDRFARALATTRSRRGVLKQISLGMVGGAIAAVLPGTLRGTEALSCAPGLVDCAGACVDLLRDPANCGVCGTPITPGNLCANGQEVARCPAGLRVCAGGCTDVTVDAKNCGACGALCSAPATCASGVCRPPGLTAPSPPQTGEPARDLGATTRGSGFCRTAFLTGVPLENCGPKESCCGQPISGIGICTLTDDDSSCGDCKSQDNCTASCGHCVANTCLPDPTKTPCGTGGNRCCDSASQCCSNNTCFLYSNAHCGPACAPCGEGKICSFGTCVCPTGQVVTGLTLASDGVTTVSTCGCPPPAKPCGSTCCDPKGPSCSSNNVCECTTDMCKPEIHCVLGCV